MLRTVPVSSFSITLIDVKKSANIWYPTCFSRLSHNWTTMSPPKPRLPCLNIGTTSALVHCKIIQESIDWTPQVFFWCTVLSDKIFPYTGSSFHQLTAAVLGSLSESLSTKWMTKRSSRKQFLLMMPLEDITIHFPQYILVPDISTSPLQNYIPSNCSISFTLVFTHLPSFWTL